MPGRFCWDQCSIKTVRHENSINIFDLLITIQYNRRWNVQFIYQYCIPKISVLNPMFAYRWDLFSHICMLKIPIHNHNRIFFLSYMQSIILLECECNTLGNLLTSSLSICLRKSLNDVIWSMVIFVFCVLSPLWEGITCAEGMMMSFLRLFAACYKKTEANKEFDVDMIP